MVWGAVCYAAFNGTSRGPALPSGLFVFARLTTGLAPCDFTTHGGLASSNFDLSAPPQTRSPRSCDPASTPGCVGLSGDGKKIDGIRDAATPGKCASGLVCVFALPRRCPLLQPRAPPLGCKWKTASLVNDGAGHVVHRGSSSLRARFAVKTAENRGGDDACFAPCTRVGPDGAWGSSTSTLHHPSHPTPSAGFAVASLSDVSARVRHPRSNTTRRIYARVESRSRLAALAERGRARLVPLAHYTMFGSDGPAPDFRARQDHVVPQSSRLSDRRWPGSG